MTGMRMTKEQAIWVKSKRLEGYTFSHIADFYKEKYGDYEDNLFIDAANILGEDLGDWYEQIRR
jgi:hypothetical protein